MKHITVGIESAAYGKCNGEPDVDDRHFDEVCREIGITYERMKGIAIAGKVYLYNCNIPDGLELPKYWSYEIDSFILNQYFGGS
ncbi:hypothetical protein ACUBZM_004341 [Enterobacter kobei]